MRAQQITAVFVAAFAVATSVAAQQTESRGRAGGGGRGPIFVEPGVGFQITESVPLEITAVKNAPFTAQAVTELTQTLGDGNRIERRFESSVARDGYGRIRREEQIALVGPLAAAATDAPRLVTLTDPVSGFSYTLDDSRNVAYRSRAVDAVKNEQLRKLAARAAEVSKQAGAVRKAEDGRVSLPAPAAAKLAEASAQPVTEDLGTRTIEGLKAQGTRTTTTIPAGAIGNVLPITIVSERWFSPELQMPVLISRRDPRSGETVYRLTNVARAEPAAFLFMVPPHYELKDGDLSFKVVDIEKAKKLKAAEAASGK